MGTSVASCPLGYRTPPTPSISSIISRSSRNSTACRLQKRQDTAWDRELKDAVTGMPTVLFPSLVHRTLLKSVIYQPPYLAKNET